MKSILYALALLGAVKALDISIEKVVCDDTLDVTADINMECNGERRCTLGSTSRISGARKFWTVFAYHRGIISDAPCSGSSVYYNGVYYSGVQDNQAYLTFDMHFLTLDLKPFEMKQISLCSGNLVSGEENQSACPGDGSYSYSVQYRLPSAGDGHPLYLASGFQGKGIIRMFAEQDERMLIGECHLTLKTYVTRTEENMYGPFETPSAAASVGMALAVSALIGLCCCYSYCCIRRKSNTQELNVENEALFSRMEDNEALFSRMEDDKSVASHAKTIAGFQNLPGSGNHSTITDIESPRKKTVLQMPLM